MTARIGLIPGIINKEMKEDFWGTVKRVAELGYQGIEGGAWLAAMAGVPPQELRERLAALGLALIADGVNRKRFEEAGEQVFDGAVASGVKFMVQYWQTCESREQLLRDAEFYNELGRRCRVRGLRFCYHNHDHEFAKFDGEHALDILMDNTDPELVSLELDVAWVRYGGLDPVAYLAKRAGRCPLIHVKDIADLGTRGAFTAIGTGVQDWPAIFQAAEKAGAEWMIVEQDRPRNLSGMEAVVASILNLREMGLVRTGS